MTTPVSVSTTDAELHPAGDAGYRPGLVSRLAAEAFGTLFLVIAGLGVPLFTIPQSSPLPAALAAGLAVTAAMLAFAYISGGHFNPAITLGNLVAGRIRMVHAAAYIGAQLVGAALGALTLFGVLRTVPTIQDTRAAFDTVTAGFGEHSVIQTPMAGVLLAEVVGAALLVAVFLGTTARRNIHAAAAPFAVGLSLAVLLQLGQAVGNAPFNPARATASALFSTAGRWGSCGCSGWHRWWARQSQALFSAASRTTLPAGVRPATVPAASLPRQEPVTTTSTTRTWTATTCPEPRPTARRAASSTALATSNRPLCTSSDAPKRSVSNTVSAYG